MKKIFALFAAVLFAGGMMAEPIIIDYSAKGYENQKDLDGVAVTEGVVSITLAKGTGSNGPKYYSTGTAARTYGGNTMTIACSEGLITTIVFDFTQNDKEYTVNAGEYSKADATWTGSADTVLFTTASGSGHNRIRSVEIYLNGEEPAADTWVPDTISVSAALALIDAKDKHDHYVVGVVMGTPFITYQNFNGKMSVWMSDVEHPSDTIEVYEALNVEKAQWASLYEAQKTLLIGDTVMFYAGALELYAAKSIYEITGGNYVETLGHNPDAEVPADPDAFEIPEGYITCEEAMKLVENLADPTAETKTIKGEEVKVCAAVTYAYSWADNKQSAWIDDKATGSGLIQAAYLAAPAEVKAGDIVLVEGKIAKYYKTKQDGSFDKIVIEIVDGTMVKQGAEGIENIELSEKVQKVTVDGVIYIVRDGKMFNMQGLQVR